MADFDNDGNQDFYVTNSGENSQNALYKGDGHGHFVDVAKEMHVADLNTDGTGTSMGALWGDFDNDGYEDLLVYKWGKPRLFHNDAGKGFTDVTEKANLPQWMNANSALIWDYDGDGKLDILLAGYFDDSLDLWHLKTTKIMPDSLQFATNGARKFLLKGNGDMTFPRCHRGGGFGIPNIGRLALSPPIYAEQGVPTCSSRTITATVSCG